MLSAATLQFDLPLLRSRLLTWYDLHRRDLPWRRPPEEADAYRTWISEVMLQQTRVDTVIPYFNRWLQRFPTLESLAAAPLDDVLKAWEGLGYYGRARRLHHAVREVVQRYGGEVPSDVDDFRRLPGVGRYTAGAVMSIAFGKEEPVVDGNVRRVFARLGDVATPSDNDLWKVAGDLVRGERPADLNQAIMDLGATICLPRAPRCHLCPLTDLCVARAAGSQLSRPFRPPPRLLPIEYHAVAIVPREGRFLLNRRPTTGRLGGLWEFPGIELRDGEDLATGACRAAAECAGVEVQPRRRVGTVRHAFSHVKVVYEVVLTEMLRAPNEDEHAAWVTESDLVNYALPRAHQKIFALIPREAATDRLTAG
jgi:A/G-specific adenine glycosylase